MIIFLVLFCNAFDGIILHVCIDICDHGNAIGEAVANVVICAVLCMVHNRNELEFDVF